MAGLCDFDANGMTVNDLMALAKVSHLTLTIMEHIFLSCQGGGLSAGQSRSKGWRRSCVAWQPTSMSFTGMSRMNGMDRIGYDCPGGCEGFGGMTGAPMIQLAHP